MSRGFTPDNPPKSGISNKLWRKFKDAHFWYDGNEKPAGVPPDMLIEICAVETTPLQWQWRKPRSSFRACND